MKSLIAALRNIDVATLARWSFLAGVFFAPVSIARMVYIGGAFADGFFNVSAAAFVSLSDVAFLISFVLFGWAFVKEGVTDEGRTAEDGERSFHPSRVIIVTTLFLIVVSAVVVPLAGDPLLALIHLYRLVAMVGVVVVIALARVDVASVVRIFLAAMCAEAAIGIAQFVTGGNLGLSFLGESIFTTETLNIAKIALLTGEVFVRAMGTLLHANVLGGMLVIALLFVVTRSRDFLHGRMAIRPYLFYFIIAILTAALFVTFSRAAWCAAGVGLALILISNWRAYIRRIGLVAAIFLILVVSYGSLVIARGGEATADLSRLAQLRVAGEMIVAHPLGVGVGRYVATVGEVLPTLPHFARQPVHNFFVLIAAEESIVVALVWLALFIVVALRAFHQKNIVGLALLAATFTLAQLDHYLATSLVGMTMLAIVFGVVLVSIDDIDKLRV